MILKTYKNLKNDEIEIEILKLNFFFHGFEELYIKTFSINQKQFYDLKKFKLLKGGFFIKVFCNKEISGFFTFVNSHKKYFELGDVFKVKFKFHRKDFSQSIRLVSDYLLKSNIADGFFGFPNSQVLDLTIEAGYKIQSYYKKEISIILLNFVILLPIFFYKKRISLNKNFFTYKFFRKISFLEKTNKKLFNLINIYKYTSSQKYKKIFIFFGLLVEINLKQSNGGPFIIFDRVKSDVINTDEIKFEMTDISV